MLGAARRPEGLSGKVAFTLIAEPEKELLHPGPGKGVPGKGNGKCKVFNPTPPPKTPLICLTELNECGSLGCVPGPG